MAFPLLKCFKCCFKNYALFQTVEEKEEAAKRAKAESEEPMLTKDKKQDK